eukprot:COSAG04_NODE_8053_length_1029_cov_2.615054_1_plen_88_part_00
MVRLHFAAPEEDRNALTDDERAEYEAAKSAPVDNAFAGRVRDELAKIFVTLPRGVGAGPSGERYEHIKAISKTAAGTAVSGCGGVRS